MTYCGFGLYRFDDGKYVRSFYDPLTVRPTTFTLIQTTRDPNNLLRLKVEFTLDVKMMTIVYIAPGNGWNFVEGSLPSSQRMWNGKPFQLTLIAYGKRTEDVMEEFVVLEVSSISSVATEIFLKSTILGFSGRWSSERNDHFYSNSWSSFRKERRLQAVDANLPEVDIRDGKPSRRFKLCDKRNVTFEIEILVAGSKQKKNQFSTRFLLTYMKARRVRSISESKLLSWEIFSFSAFPSSHAQRLSAVNAQSRSIFSLVKTFIRQSLSVQLMWDNRKVEEISDIEAKW